MIPDTAFLAITAASKAAEEWSKFLQTPAGQRLVEKQLDDIERLSAFFRAVAERVDVFAKLIEARKNDG